MSVMQTVSLQLHQPSAIKIAVIEQAFSRFGAGTRQLLAAARPEASAVPPADKSAQWAFINQFLSRREVIGRLNSLSAQPFKDAIKRQFAAVLNRWFAQRLLQPAADYPTLGTADHLVSFCRYSDNRDYCLLYDTEKQRYYAKLHLLCRDDPPFAMPEKIIPARFRMVGGEVLLTSASPRYMLVPLSFGRRQLQLLEAARAGSVRPRTACLIRKGDAYYLNVTLEVPTAEPETPACFLGLARGLHCGLFAAVCDRQGQLVAEEQIPVPDLDPSASQAEHLHRLANRIVSLVGRHRAQLIVENLSFCNDRLAYDGQEPVLSVRDYMALKALLQYKLPLANLPPPVPVSPARLYCTCPRCGQAANSSRLNAEVFLCTSCGYGSAADSAGSLNLARRMIQYDHSRIIFTEKPVDGGFEYRNKRFGIAVSLPSRPEFENYLLGLAQSAHYDRRQAALVRSLNSTTGLVDKIDIVTEN